MPRSSATVGIPIDNPTNNGDVRQKLLDQLEYVRAEFEALAPLVKNIDPQAFLEEPLDGTPSVQAAFVSLITAQDQLMIDTQADSTSVSDGSDSNLVEVLRSFVGRRDDLLRHFKHSYDEDWSEEFVKVIYEFVMNESAVLQSIAARLYESNIFRH